MNIIPIFLRVFNNLILLIALYVAFFCIGNFELLIENDTDIIKSPIQIHSDFINIIAEYMRPYQKYVNILSFLFFVVFYLWLVCIRTLFLRYIVICVAYILTFIGIGTSIALINPLIGKLVYDSIKINNYSLLLITFAYTILMALVLFSLQKTARKNSIIPS